MKSTKFGARNSEAALLLLRLALRRLLRRLGLLRFRFLRHCCPPSHDELAMPEQCLRESQALQSDYYSAIKKTRTPLNEVCTARRAPPRGARARNLRSAQCGARFIRYRARASKFHDRRNPHEIRTFSLSFNCRQHLASAPAPARARQTGRRPAATPSKATSEKFFSYRERNRRRRR